MSKKTTRRAMLASVVALALCFTMLIGTTYAWFTDSVVSGNNIIKSGTLDIDLEVLRVTNNDPVTKEYLSIEDNNDPIFNYDRWEPGYTEWANVRVVNKGNLALKYTMKIVADGEVSALADVIDVYYAPLAVEQPATRSLANLTNIGTLRDAIDGNVYIDDKMLPGGEDFATIVLHMQEEAGNAYQNLAIGSSFSFQILATQLTYESDSFGIDYDENAQFPIVASTRAALVSAFNMAEDGDTIVLDVDLPTAIINVDNGKKINLDLNGNDIAVLQLWDADVTLKGEGKIGYPGYQGVSLNSDNSKLTVGKDVEIVGTWGITLFGTNNEVNMYGTVNSDIFVSGNIHDSNNVVNIYGTINNTADDGVGVALNGDATVNVFEGAKITGATGIEVRAGNLNVYGGEITGTAKPTEFTPNGNGTTSTGAGIAVAQHTTVLPINVVINGGTIKGYTPLYEKDVQNNGETGLAKISITVNGGIFEAINDGTNLFGIEDEGKITYNNTLLP